MKSTHKARSRAKTKTAKGESFALRIYIDPSEKDSVLETLHEAKKTRNLRSITAYAYQVLMEQAHRDLEGRQ